MVNNSATNTLGDIITLLRVLNVVTDAVLSISGSSV
jgi:hypothetical protein